MIFSYTLLIKLLVELTLVFSAYKLIKTDLDKKVKISLFAILGIISYIVFTLNFNFAKDIKLDQKRIEGQNEIMIKKGEVKQKVLPDMVKTKDSSTTNYIEQQAEQIHNSVINNSISKKEK